MTLQKADILTALGETHAPSSDFDLNPGTVPPNAKLRHAAVLVPIWARPDGLRLILTKRAAHLKAHPGQISFPGGARDPGDVDLQHTALREMEEEVGVDPSRVEVLGTLPPHQTVTTFQVTPVVGWITGDLDFQIDPAEVAEVFDVPFSHTMDPKNYIMGSRKWMGVDRYYYTVPYGPHYIWGATARILRGIAARFEP